MKVVTSDNIRTKSGIKSLGLADVDHKAVDGGSMILVHLCFFPNIDPHL